MAGQDLECGKITPATTIVEMRTRTLTFLIAKDINPIMSVRGALITPMTVVPSRSNFIKKLFDIEAWLRKANSAK